MELGSGHELLNTVRPERVAEVRIPELAFEDPFLLLLHTPARLEGQAHHPFDVLIGNGHAGIRE